MGRFVAGGSKISTISDSSDSDSLSGTTARLRPRDTSFPFDEQTLDMLGGAVLSLFSAPDSVSLLVLSVISTSFQLDSSSSEGVPSMVELVSSIFIKLFSPLRQC
ncbi:hypothetical protein H0H81_010958 [Sphagnurus paluster]|uniref:Uncharacterized protein n=1 Tax=Sphagnurus paluster TaxID=117069 RepID=A0A9P7GJF0_9AGAR|nr:hypothetical protein H0H81_010958 [Sphagnurus paluster]